MGGFGSGRPSGSGRDTVEACRSIDVNRLHREGCLRPGWWGGWQWTRDGEKVASINLRAETDRLHLSYRVCIGGGEWEDVAETVRIVRVPCRFGGERPYFICPGVVNGIACGRRVVKLHGPGAISSAAIAIASPMPARARAHGTGRCGAPTRSGSASAAIPAWPRRFPPKPKGMWRRTYERLREQAFEAEMLADEAFAIRAERLLARIDKPETKEELLGMTRPRPPCRPRPAVPRSPASTRCATACCRATPCCPGRMPTNTARLSRRSWPSMRRRDRPRSIWSRRLAGILWRKRRLRLAEAAAHRRGLDGTLASYRETVKVALVHLDATGQSERVVDAIRATAADTEEDIARDAGGRGHDAPRPRPARLQAQRRL